MISKAKSEAHGFLEGGGEMAAVIAGFDWSTTPLGPIENWPPTLKAVTSLILRSPVPLVTLWGPLGIMLYNDAYSVFAGQRHPRLLGSEVRKGWPEVADWNDNVMKVGLAGGILSYRDQLLVLSRHGHPEDVWLDLDYSPITDESGAPVGVIAIVVEITEKKRVLQRAAALAELGEAIARTADPDELAYAAGALIGRELDVSRAGYGVIDTATETVRLTRNFAAPGTENLQGVRAFRNYGNFIDDLKQGRTVVVTDAREDARTRDHAEALEGVHARALVNVPVTEQGGVVALLYVNNAAPRGWTEEEIGFIREVAERIRTAIERRRAEQSVRENEAKLRLLDELNEIFRENENPEDVAYAAAQMLGRALHVSRAGYGFIDKDAETITITRDWNAPGIKSLAGTLQFRDYGSYIEDLKRGETVIFSDARKDPRVTDGGAALQGISAVSLINMPVTEQGGIVALLYLNNATPRDWSEGEIAFVREVAERTRVAVERRRAERSVRDHAARLTFLDALGRQTARSNDADAILSVTTEMLGRHLGVSICAYADMEADEDHFTIRGDWAGPGSSSIVGYYSLADFGKLAVEKLGAGEPLVINDNRTELPPEEAATFQAIGITATICMPLVKEGRLTALMAVHQREPRLWTGNERALLAEVTERSWAHIERVRDVAMLRTSESQFRTMAQAMPNHVWTATPDGLLDWLNDQTYIYSGAMPRSLTGTGWASIVHPDDLNEAAAGWANALETGQPYQVEFRLKRADGQFRWHIARAVPVRDEAGTVTRWVGTNTDIQDQKEIAAALEDLNATLEHRVRDRTAQLQKTEQALQQAQKMEAIGNLTGGIAHDFNNLLMAVSGSMELLRKRLPPDPGLLRLVDNAMEGARRGASLTKRMLAFARRQPLQPERIDLALLVDGMAELLQRSLGPMIALEVRFPRGLPAVETDPNQLESALLNLAVNARDAMNGEGRIVISARVETAAGEGALRPGSYVCLSLADTGEGMDAETLKRATEPFFTTKGVGKGTGLGLSMVHGLAEQSGGALVLHSRPGKGTRAEIWLPAVNTPAPARVAPAAAPPAPARIPALKILAVDDDALVLMNTADMLEDMGHSVAAVGSGAEALALLGSGRKFDLVITDHAMPQMTGAQLAQEIARTRPGLPVLLATGYAELPPDADIGLPRLSKPFTQGELAEALARNRR